MASVVSIFFAWHDGDVVDEDLQFVVVEILDEFVVEVLELLKAVIVIKELVDGAIFVVE